MMQEEARQKIIVQRHENENETREYKSSFVINMYI